MNKLNKTPKFTPGSNQPITVHFKDSGSWSGQIHIRTILSSLLSRRKSQDQTKTSLVKVILMLSLTNATSPTMNVPTTHLMST